MFDAEQQLIKDAKAHLEAEQYKDKHGHSLPPCDLIKNYRTDVPALTAALERLIDSYNTLVLNSAAAIGKILDNEPSV
jgi:hypothetical protein